MGKVREETLSKPSNSEGSKQAPARQGKSRFIAFLGNLARVDRYKPSQGKMARLWTAIGLGVIVGAGVLTLRDRYFIDMALLPSYLWPAGIAVLAAWFVWRIVEYPPFVDFLIATEAEMVKVSWTTKEELQRATVIVLVTVLILSLYLAGVDLAWSFLLRAIGVLKFGGEGLGSQDG
jgi:preprotein translocase subunit SecE